MSSHSHDDQMARRTFVRSAAALAALPLLGSIARADCPCGGEAESKKEAPAPAKPAASLRVCADPNNLPFSNRAHEGFEDKIAALIARELNLPLEYDWLPQRLGFYRTALKTFDANLVMAAPSGFEKALITVPYYRSTYVFVQRKDAKAQVKSFDDLALRDLKIGIPLAGADGTPPALALAKRKLIDNVTGFNAFDESEGRPGERIISAVAAGEIDVGIAWGPQVGFFANPRRQKTAITIVPVSPTHDIRGEATIPFTYAICMGLRRPDAALRDRINAVIHARRKEIDAILDEYAVPRLPLEETGTDFGTGKEAKREN